MLYPKRAIITFHMCTGFLGASAFLLAQSAWGAPNVFAESFDGYTNSPEEYESYIADAGPDESLPANQSSNGLQNIGFNTPARPFAQKGWNLWARGDALYWRASEDNLFYAYTGNDLNGDRNRKIETVDFDWDWGFRIGIGYNVPHDRWDLALYWTRFHTSVHSSVAQNPPEKNLFVNWWLHNFLGSVGISEVAEGYWRSHLDQIDLSLGREFYVGRRLTVRPHAGLRSSWIRQKFVSQFDTTTGVTTTKMKNNFWGFGFFGGLDTKWMLSNDWHLFANGDLAILYGNFDISEKGKVNKRSFFSIEDDLHAGRGVADLQAGLAWSHLFFNKRVGFTLKAGYEYHLYPDQNQLPLPTGNDDFPNSFIAVGGDLAYQGLFLSGQIDF